jgi:hypothetical protein
MASGDPLDHFIVGASTALGLPIKPEWLPAVRANLEVTLRFGVIVDTFPLPDEAEPAPRFEA